MKERELSHVIFIPLSNADTNQLPKKNMLNNMSHRFFPRQCFTFLTPKGFSMLSSDLWVSTWKGMLSRNRNITQRATLTKRFGRIKEYTGDSPKIRGHDYLVFTIPRHRGIHSWYTRFLYCERRQLCRSYHKTYTNYNILEVRFGATVRFLRCNWQS